MRFRPRESERLEPELKPLTPICGSGALSRRWPSFRWSSARPGLPSDPVAGRSESSTAPPPLQSRAVPELPDLTVVAEALNAALTGREIASVDARGPLAVRGTPSEQAALVGQGVKGARRRGKFLLVDLSQDAIVFNPMLTGRFQLAGPKAKRPQKTAFVLGFGPRVDGPPASAAGWTPGATWMPADA